MVPSRVPLSQYRLVLPFLRPHRRALLFILLVSLLATATGLGRPQVREAVRQLEESRTHTVVRGDLNKVRLIRKT